MALITDFERYVLPFVANAPAPAVEDALVDACVEFCTRTKVLRQMLDPVTLIAGMAEYALDAPDGDSVITEVLTAWLPEGKIDPYTRPDLDARYPDGWAQLTAAGTAEVTGYYCRLPGFIRLIPTLSVKMDRALTLEVACAPTRTATKVEDVLFDRYAEVIAAGALSRLHQHPSAKYADPTRVSAYTSVFENAVSTLADDANRGFAHKQLRTIPEQL